MNPTALRLFIGDVGEHFTLDLRNGTPSKLFISFRIRRSIQPSLWSPATYVSRFAKTRGAHSDHATYNDPLITGAKFTEHDGVTELDITGTGTLMANFADGGKTIVVTGRTAASSSGRRAYAQPDLHIPTVPHRTALRKSPTPDHDFW